MYKVAAGRFGTLTAGTSLKMHHTAYASEPFTPRHSHLSETNRTASDRRVLNLVSSIEMESRRGDIPTDAAMQAV